MGWKIVRDRNEEWCRAHGVSGQWRTSPDPVAALRKKIFEEAGEYAEHRDVAELFDLRDVVDRLIALADPQGAVEQAHADKITDMGLFERLIEWCPVPAAIDMGYLSLPAEVQADIESQLAERGEDGSDGPAQA